jgi:hypothetical protein
MIAVAIITSPRPSPVNVLTITLDSYYQCWDVVPHVFAEPGSLKTRHQTHWHNNPTCLKNMGNWIGAAKYMLTYVMEPYFAIMEDDVIFHTLASIRVRQRILLGETNCISPYCAQVNRREASLPGWIEARTDKSGWCGNMCLVFPRLLLQKIIENEDKLRLYSKGRNGTNEELYHADYAVGRVIEELGYKIICHQPTLVLHQDVPSTNEQNNRHRSHVNKARLPAL